MLNQTIPALTPQNAFARYRLWQSWLDVEAAMALAQAEIGMVPDWAATEIAQKARLENFDLEALERSAAETMAPIVSLVRALSAICGEAGHYVHWGATTQNIMSTGRLLLLRKAHRGVLTGLVSVLETLGGWAEVHAGTVMAGRTNRRHALPITFGFKVAGWIEELARQNDRFAATETRLFALHFGGATGAMHSFAGQGEALAANLARRLDLTPVLVPDRVSLDAQAEYVASLGLFAMTIGRIAGELYRLMADEIGEVSERLAEGVIGSSTMPHKVNPKHVVSLIAGAAQLRALVAPALEAGMPSHEGDASNNQLMSGTLEQASALAWTLVQRLQTTLDQIEVHPARMAQNLNRSADFIATEHLMMVLADKIGRTLAHDLVHHAVADAVEGKGQLADLLLQVPEIGAAIDRAALEAALAPASYLGDSVAISRKAAELAGRTSRMLRASRCGPAE